VAFWLRVTTIKVWDHVAIFHLFVEFFFAVGEAGSLLGGIPFLGALAVAMSPPGRVDLGGSSEAI